MRSILYHIAISHYTILIDSILSIYQLSLRMICTVKMCCIYNILAFSGAIFTSRLVCSIYDAFPSIFFGKNSLGKIAMVFYLFPIENTYKNKSNL